MAKYLQVETDEWHAQFTCPTSELEFQIKKINPTHSSIFLFILQKLDIIHIPHLDFIRPNCLKSQESISSFRKMKKKEYNKKGDKITTQPD